MATALGCTLNGCGPGSLSVDEVIERNTQAMGGRAAIEAVKSIEVDLHIIDRDFEVDGKYRAARPGRMRIDILTNGKHVYTEGFDGDRGWKWKGKGNDVEEGSPKVIAVLRQGSMPQSSARFSGRNCGPSCADNAQRRLLFA